VYEDNQYEAAQAVTAFNKLVTSSNVNLIYNWGEGPLYGIAPLAEARQLPVLALSLDPIPAMGKKYIMRVNNEAEQYAQTLLGYFREKGYKRIAIIQTEDPFLNTMIEGLRKNLRADESVEVLFTFLPDQNDFHTIITKLKTSKFDTLGIYLFTGQVSSFYRQAGDMHLKVPTFGTDFFESRSEIRDAKGFMDGAVYPNIFVPQKFQELYSKKFGNDIQIAYAYNAYGTFQHVGALRSELEASKDGAQMISILAQNDRSAEHRFTFRDTPAGGRFYQYEIVVKQIEKDHIIVADPTKK